MTSNKTCSKCGANIYRCNKSGMCRACIAADPGMKEKRLAAMRLAYQLRPELVAAATERIRAVTRTPEHSERARRMMLEGRLWERGTAAKGGPGSEVNKRAGRAVSAARLAHIPPELRDDYRRLVTHKGFTAAEATSLITDQHELQMARWRREIGAPAIKRRRPQPAAVVRPVEPEEPEPFAPMPIFSNMSLFDRAIAHTVNETKITRSRILSGERIRPVVRARWIVASVLREAGRSYPLIARMLKLKDHSTVLYGVREAPNMARYDQEFGRALETVLDACRPFIASAKAAALAEAA